MGSSSGRVLSGVPYIETLALRMLVDEEIQRPIFFKDSKNLYVSAHIACGA